MAKNVSIAAALFRLALVGFLCLASFGAYAGRCLSVLRSLAAKWSADPVPSRAYTHEALMNESNHYPEAQKIVIHKDRIFFIDEQRLFSIGWKSAAPTYHNVFGLDVLSVVPYDNSLAVLQRGGVVSIFDREANAWIEIGEAASKILSTGSHLFALIGRSLWVYRGQPDSVSVPFPFSATLRGGFSFRETKAQNLKDIELTDDGLNVVIIPRNRPPEFLKKSLW